MLYSRYEVVYYFRASGKCPVEEYIVSLDKPERAEILQSINYLRKNEGRLPAPYSKHISGKIWELRIKYLNRRHRILYFIASLRKIVLLSAFMKKTKKTPWRETRKAQNYHFDYLSSI